MAKGKSKKTKAVIGFDAHKVHEGLKRVSSLGELVDKTGMTVDELREAIMTVGTSEMKRLFRSREKMERARGEKTSDSFATKTLAVDDVFVDAIHEVRKPVFEVDSKAVRRDALVKEESDLLEKIRASEDVGQKLMLASSEHHAHITKLEAEQADLRRKLEQVGRERERVSLELEQCGRKILKNNADLESMRCRLTVVRGEIEDIDRVELGLTETGELIVLSGDFQLPLVLDEEVDELLKAYMSSDEYADVRKLEAFGCLRYSDLYALARMMVTLSKLDVTYSVDFDSEDASKVYSCLKKMPAATVV